MGEKEGFLAIAGTAKGSIAPVGDEKPGGENAPPGRGGMIRHLAEEAYVRAGGPANSSRAQERRAPRQAAARARNPV